MRVDEARRDDLAGGIHGLGALQRLFADRDDATVGDADIGDIVIHRFGINDAPIVNNEVIVLRHGWHGKSCQAKEQSQPKR